MIDTDDAKLKAELDKIIKSINATMKKIEKMTDLQHYGFDYAKTLDLWRQNLLAKRQEILGLGYDDRFLRKWEYYFAYCQAGFAAQIIDLTHFVLNKPEQS